MKWLKKYLWDKNIELNEALNDIEVFARVLNYATAREVKEFIINVGIREIRNFISKYPYKLEEKSLNFWRMIFEIKGNKKNTKSGIRNSCKIWNNR